MNTKLKIGKKPREHISDYLSQLSRTAEVLGTGMMEEGTKEKSSRFDDTNVFENFCEKLPNLKGKQQT